MSKSSGFLTVATLIVTLGCGRLSEPEASEREEPIQSGSNGIGVELSQNPVVDPAGQLNVASPTPGCVGTAVLRREPNGKAEPYRLRSRWRRGGWRMTA